MLGMSEIPEKRNIFQRLGGHLQTVHHHRALVRKFCFACGLYRQGLSHDLSKYSPSELIPSVRYYQGWRSPYAYEKELRGVSEGWLHHKGHNKHHWEYWWDCIHGVWQPVPMPDRYIVESLCDRIAACRTYHKEKYTQHDALAYYLSKNDARHMHPETAAKMERLLRLVDEQGEEAAFKAIRQKLRNHEPL